MGRFQRSERGGQVDPQEALRRARDAVARERAARGEEHTTERDIADGPDEELVEEAMREHDEHEEHDEGR